MFFLDFLLLFLFHVGQDCEENVDECLSNPCQNGGICIDKDNGYMCTCSPGYLGSHCEFDVAVCKTGNCRNVFSTLYVQYYIEQSWDIFKTHNIGPSSRQNITKYALINVLAQLCSYSSTFLYMYKFSSKKKINFFRFSQFFSSILVAVFYTLTHNTTTIHRRYAGTLGICTIYT